LLFDRLRERFIDQLADRPNVIGDPDRHCRGDPQGFVNSAQIEVRNEEPDSRYVVFKLLAEGVRQAGETPLLHPDRQVPAFDIRRANPPLIADQSMPPYPYYYAGRVSQRCIDRGLAVVLLDYLPVGAIRTE
jgi:hypothetical protein